MQERVAQALDEALASGIVTSPQREQLGRLFAERGLIRSGLAGSIGILDSDPDDTPTATELAESPRLVRGFHDILITIGVVAALGGLWGLLAGVGLSSDSPASMAVLLVAIIALAELLVRRQRLALPAFVLTLFFGTAIVRMVAPMLGVFMEEGDGAAAAGITFLIAPLLLLPFYWRYRVPVALAGMIVMAAMSLFLLVQALFGGDIDEFVGRSAQITIAIALVVALALFAIALSFDMSDPARNTRRSDVAFWLHLAAAPALLFTLFAILLGPERGIWWANEPTAREAVLAIILVTIMMLIGIVIDRRAFVTAGLISLGVAVYVLASRYGVDLSLLSAFAVFAVGMIVLTLGVGWQRLRSMIVSPLPASWRRRLHPL